jgi:hypothetical protein
VSTHHLQAICLNILHSSDLFGCVFFEQFVSLYRFRAISLDVSPSRDLFYLHEIGVLYFEDVFLDMAPFLASEGF